LHSAGELWRCFSRPGHGLKNSVGEAEKTNRVVIELFYRSDSEQSQNAKKFLQEFQAGNSGIEVKAYDLLEDKKQLARLWQLSKRFGRDKAGFSAFPFGQHQRTEKDLAGGRNLYRR
jgi:hypothetical protein